MHKTYGMVKGEVILSKPMIILWWLMVVIQKKATYMDMDKMCNFPSNKNALTHWNCIFWCCANCKSLLIPGQELNRDDTRMCTTIWFHELILVSQSTVHGIIPLSCSLCSTAPTTERETKLYKRKELELMDKYVGPAIMLILGIAYNTPDIVLGWSR